MRPTALHAFSIKLHVVAFAAVTACLSITSCTLFKTDRQQVATPLVSPDGSFFEKSIRVTIAFPEERKVEIRYTLDGSEPTTSSPLYSSPLILEESCVLNAAAFNDGLMQGGATRSRFTKQSPQVRPKRIILCVIDSMSSEMLDMLPLTNMNRLISNGVTIRSTENIMPYLPNPVPEGYRWKLPASVPALASGTIFVGTKELDRHMLQNCFTDNTAFISNSSSFFKDKEQPHMYSISDGYKISHNLIESEPGIETKESDKAVFEDAKRIIEGYDPTLLSMYLCSTDYAVQGDSKADRKIWDKDSGWQKAMLETDRLLGDFLSWLEKKRLAKDTLIIITGNTGVSGNSKHPIFEMEVAEVPTIIAGAGVKKGKIISYAESIDILPTICWLTGAETPATSQGKVISEAFAGTPDTSIRSDKWLRRLNQVLCNHNTLMANPTAREFIKKEEAAFMKLHSSFIGIDRIPSWHDDRRSVAELAVRNEAIYKQMNSMVTSYSKPVKEKKKKSNKFNL